MSKSPLAPALERARALIASGDLGPARVLLERAVELGRENLGEDEPDVLTVQRELAGVFLLSDDPMRARRMLEDAYAAGQWKLGDSDPIMLHVSHDLGVVAEELGNKHEARKAFGRVAANGPAVLGDGHRFVARARAYLGEEPSAATVSPGASPAEPDRVTPPVAGLAPDTQAGVGPRAAIGHPDVSPITAPVTRGVSPSESADQDQPSGTVWPPSQSSPALPVDDRRSAPPQVVEAPVRQSRAASSSGDDASPAAHTTGQAGHAAAPPAHPAAWPGWPGQAEPDGSGVTMPPGWQGPPNRRGIPHPGRRDAAGGAWQETLHEGGEGVAGGAPDVAPSPHRWGPQDPAWQQAPGPAWQEAPGPAWQAGAPRPAVLTHAHAADGGVQAHPYQGRGRGLAVGLTVTATLVALSAVGALVVVLADRERLPPAEPQATVSVGPVLAGDPPSAVRLDDRGDAVQLTWRDPAEGRAPFVVTMARAGQQLKPVSNVGLGKTQALVEGLNAKLEYCFAVVAVYSTDRFASSGQVCTERS